MRMKRFTPVLVVALLLTIIASPFAFAASAPAAGRPPIIGADKSPSAAFAGAISTVTGIAISPLLGTAAYGAYQWMLAKDDMARAALPWFAQVKFWLPALILIGVVAAKDSIGTMLPPGAKKPLDVLEVIENKMSGLVAAGAVIPFTMDFLSKEFVQQMNAMNGGGGFDGLATLPFAASFHLSWLLNILTVPFGIAVFAVVWMASHAINVLILLSPWGAIDAALKAARTSLLGLIVLTTTINPWVGASLSIVVIIIAYFVAGWAFRLTIFGTIFSWDYLTLRRHRFSPAENDNRMFAGPNLPGVPIRSYGRLVQRTAGGLEFVYRPWLVLAPRVAPVSAEPASLGIGEGLIFSDIVTRDNRTLFSLPPRYRGHEETLARAYLMGGGVRPAGIRKAWSSLLGMLGGRAAQSPAPV